MELRNSPAKDTSHRSSEERVKYPGIIGDTLEATKLMYAERSVESNEMNSRGDPPNDTTGNVPSIVVNDVDEDNDDPPPYTAIVPPNHVGWPFDFSSGIPYSVHTTTPYRTDLPLAPFQSSGYYSDGSNGQHTSITVPLMPYRIFKFGSHRSLFMQRSAPDNNSIAKDTGGKTRRYGVVVVAAAVIVFLMALSLMVRFLVDKSIWRG